MAHIVWTRSMKLCRAERAPRIRTYKVKDNPLASVTQRPRADQHGGCSWKSGWRCHGRPLGTSALGQGLTHELVAVPVTVCFHLNEELPRAGSSFQVSSPP